MTYSESLSESLFALAWSQWTELGVAGLERHHDKTAIDPEALILLTAGLSEDDPRLRDESIDWCASHGDRISVARLKNLVSLELCSPFELYRYTATVRAHSHLRWPTSNDVEPIEVRLSGKSRAPDLARPGLIRLRLRALFGVSARAEVIVELMAASGLECTASDLVGLGYSKRHLANVLDDLAASDLVERRTVGNEHRYVLERAKELRAFIGEVPFYFPAWGDWLRVLVAMRKLAHEGAHKSPRLAALQTQRVLEQLGQVLERLGQRPPKPEIATDSFDVVLDWAVSIATRAANGPPDPNRPSSMFAW